MFPILFIISCDQSNEIVIPKVGDDYKAQYHFSCNPIGWSRDNIKDRKPVGEYLNYLFYGTYTMDDPPKWLQKKNITLDFERNYFNGYENEDEFFNTSINFYDKSVNRTIKNCYDKSPLGSCSIETWSFNRITKQLEFENISASDLEGEISLYNCVRADRVGEDYQYSQPKEITLLDELKSLDAEN
jgi:hypothetical protein